MITKIYFIENSFDYNALNFNDSTIAGAEKILERTIDKDVHNDLLNNITAKL